MNQLQEASVWHRLSTDNMHAIESIVPLIVVFSWTCSSTSAYTTETSYQTDIVKKCCGYGYLFNEHLKCVKNASMERMEQALNRKLTGDSTSSSNGLIELMHGTEACFGNGEVAAPMRNNRSRKISTTPGEPSEFCVESMINGTQIIIECSVRSSTVNTMETTSTMDRTPTAIKMHGMWDLGTVVFWGAQTYMSTNMAHVVLCTLVVVTYLSVPELGKTLHDRAVLRHSVCLLCQGCVLTFMGYYDLCGCTIDDNLTIFLWLLQQYLTIATVFWLNVICFDMTLSITRFRWMVGSGQRSDREENRRALLYGGFAWIGALMPTVLAALIEYWPGLEEDFLFKPNYLRYRDGPSVTVNLYFFAIPLFTLFWNNVLFIYTTYKILRIQRSTKIATKNHTNILTKKYFLFLRLYLLMGAPWFFGCLFACLNKLVTLKICRLIQPILWLLMLCTHKKFRRKLAAKVRLLKYDDRQGTTVTP